MEHMYVHSVVCENVLRFLVAIFGQSINCVYMIWNCPVRSRYAAKVFPLPRFYQILSCKIYYKRKKKLYEFKQAIRIRFTGISSR